MLPSRFRPAARSRLLGRAGLLAGPAALALAGVAFAVGAAPPPPNGVTARGWVEAPSNSPAPDARDDYRTVAEDSGALIVPVMHNDKDQDGVSGKQLEVTDVNDPPHGTAIVIQGSGSRDQISYTPDHDYCNDPSGRDDVRYEVTNSLDNKDVARVRMRVTCVDDPPPAGASGAEASGGVTNTDTTNSNPGRAAFESSLLRTAAGASCIAGGCLDAGASAASTRGSVYRVTVRGRFRGTPCLGRVRFTYRVSGTRTVRHTARIGRTCRYRKTVRLRTSARTTLPATLRISQRFPGNRRTKPGSGKTLRVKLQGR